MQLDSQHLTLVPLGTRYLESAHDYAGDPENTRYMFHLPNHDLAETKAFLTAVENEWQKAEPEFYEFAVLLKEEDGSTSHIGAVSSNRTDEADVYEMGWIINRRYWGHGYAYEAAALVLDFSFQTLGAKRIIAHCDLENERSAHLMRKLGMQEISRDGRRRNRSADRDSFEMLFAIEKKA